MITKKLKKLVESFSDLNIIELEQATESLNSILAESDFSDIQCSSISQDSFEKITYVTLVDTSSGDEQTLMFFVAEDGVPVCALMSDLDSDDEEIETLDLTTFSPIIENGSIVFNDLSWFDPVIIEFVFDDSIDEAFLTVIRGGKKVKKKLIRKKRKKRPSAALRLALRRGAKKRKLKNAQIQRKRKKSLKLRNRSKLKSKPKNMRVV